MKMTVSLSKFRDEMADSQYERNFSYDGLARIYRELEEIYDGEYELDIPEVAMWYTEYASLLDYNKDRFDKDWNNYVESMEELEDLVRILSIDGSCNFIVVE